MATKPMKVIRERLKAEMLAVEIPMQYVNFVDKRLATYGDEISASPLAGRARVRLATREVFDALKVGGFKDFPGYEINPQSVRSAATKMNDVLMPKRFVCRVHGGGIRVYRAPDLKVKKRKEKLRPIARTYFDLEEHVRRVDAEEENET